MKKRAKTSNGKLPIHVVEDLTGHRAALAAKARNAHAEKKLLGAWTTNGKVKVRLLDDSIKIIKNSNDLPSTAPPPSVPGEGMTGQRGNDHHFVPAENVSFKPRTQGPIKFTNRIPQQRFSHPQRTSTPQSRHPGPWNFRAGPPHAFRPRFPVQNQIYSPRQSQLFRPSGDSAWGHQTVFTNQDFPQLQHQFRGPPPPIPDQDFQYDYESYYNEPVARGGWS